MYPKPYAGHITMFSSVGNSERQKAHWGPLATRRPDGIFEVAATHDDIVLPPYSKLLAEHFDASPRCRCAQRMKLLHRRLKTG